jgi:hypothetical protein
VIGVPVGGGTFTVQNKILPGAYINFVSASGASTLGSRGVAALPLELDWGPEDQVFTVEAAEFAKTCAKVFGCDPTDPALLLVREALKRASALKLYRVNGGGAKATKTIGGMAVTAKWGGLGGNKIRVGVAVNADDEDKMDVTTYLDTQAMDVQIVAAAGGAADLHANDFVTFGSADTLTAAAPAALAGGTNGTASGETYAAFLAAIEVEQFQTIGYPGTDTAVKTLFSAFVRRLRDEDGRKIVGVLYQHAGDHMGLINLKNGVVLADGTVVPGEQAVAWVAGASAAANINESLTNTAYDGAVDADIRYTKSQMEAAIEAGEFVFYGDFGTARVLSDINSLTTYPEGVSKDWSSNRVVRVMDGWANDTARIFGQNYIGLTTNDDTGRQLFRADLVSLAKQYQGIGAISNFVAEDIAIAQGDGKRDVVVTTALQPNDSMEKLYMTVTVV